jgi:hypothetical protein
VSQLTEPNPELEEANAIDTRTRETMQAIQIKIMLKQPHPKVAKAKPEVVGKRPGPKRQWQ